MTRHYPNKITEAVARCLKEKDLDFDYREETNSFFFRIGLHEKIKLLPFNLHVNDTGFTVRGLIPIGPDTKDPEMMAQINDFVNRANDFLTEGNFEFSCKDGTLRYKVNVNCKGLPVPTKDMILSSIYCIMAMCDRYGKGFGNIIYGNMSAAEAIVLCEGPNIHVSPEEDEEPSDDLIDASAEDDVIEAFPDPEDVDTIPDLDDYEMTPSWARPRRRIPTFPQYDEYEEDEDTSDILRKLRELREED